MLPYADRQPADFHQTAVVPSVSSGVLSEFCDPPVLVVLRNSHMIRATMPETAVDENGNARPG